MKPNILFVLPLTSPFDNLTANMTKSTLPVENLAAESLAMPLGLMYISSYIKENNDVGKISLLDYKINIGDLSNYASLEEFIKKIAVNNVNFDPDVLAFSIIVSTSQYFFQQVVTVLKEIWPKATTVIGGFHATNFTRELLVDPNVDYVVRGEGELPFSQFIDQFSKSQAMNVNGVYSRANLNNDGPLKLGEFVQDLDEIPLPDWGLLDMERYVKGVSRAVKKADEGKPARLAEIMTTRGCPFQCTFCSSHSVHGRDVRYRSIENVVEEIEVLHKQYGVNTFLAEDDLFTSKKSRTINLLKALSDLSIPNFEMQFPVALSVNTLDEEVLDVLIATGMSIASLAIESGSPYVQKHIIRKRCNLEKAVRLVKYLKKKNVPTRCSFVLGYPKETKEHLRETLEFAKELSADWNDFFVATPLPGSEMCQEFVDLGYIEYEIDMMSNSYYSKRAFDTNEISAKELTEFAYRANLECNFINNPTKLKGNYKQAIEIFENIVNKHQFHIIGWYCIMECFEQLQDGQAAEKIREKIEQLIETDKRASEMYAKYNDLMPGIKIAAISTN